MWSNRTKIESTRMKVLLLVLAFVNADSIGFNRQQNVASSHLIRRLQAEDSSPLAEMKINMLIRQWNKNDIIKMKKLVDAMRPEKKITAQGTFRQRRFSRYLRN